MSWQEEINKKHYSPLKFNIWDSPFLWLFLMFFLWLLVKINLLSIRDLAINSQTLRNPINYYRVFSAGISHKSFLHLSLNLILLVGLYWLSFKEAFYRNKKNFIQLAIFINLIQGFLLSFFLISENSLQKYIYGSSGIVCGILSFFLIHSLRNKKRIPPFLGIALISIFLLSIVDLIYFPSLSLGSLSHLLGLLAGLILSFLPFQKEVIFSC